MSGVPDTGDLRDRLQAILPRFAGRRIAVAGDLVADRYVLAEPLRLSREAPVVVARHTGERFIPGGAANAAWNLLALGAEVLPFGIVGQDLNGEGLTGLFRDRGVDVSGIVGTPGYRTIAKTRFLVGEVNRSKQQLLRVDEEPEGPPLAAARDAVRERLRDRIRDVDAVILSDYGYGLVDGVLLSTVLEGAEGRVVTADSRYCIADFGGVTLATPNVHEVEEAVQRPIRTDSDLEAAGRELHRRLGASALLLTRGNKGMSLFRTDLPRLDIPAIGTEEVTDVSGAGDTVTAVTTLALAAGADLEEAAWLSNLAAGVVVMKVGAATCSPAELAETLERHL